MLPPERWLLEKLPFALPQPRIMAIKCRKEKSSNAVVLMVHVHMKRHAMSDLPETDDEVAQWCKDIFMAKDALLDKHLAEGTFGDEHYKPIGHPVKSLLVVLSWACLLLFATFRFFKWSALLSTWKGSVIAALGLLLVTAVMHLFILFSQSERSSPAKVAPSRPKKE